MKRYLATLILLGMLHAAQSQSYRGNKTSRQHQKLIVNEYNPKHENYHCYVVHIISGKAPSYQKTLFSKHLVATDHSVAVIYRNNGLWVGHHNGIKIWTSQQNEWVTFDVPWPRKIIGWINE